jgi:hypothetical protein
VKTGVTESATENNCPGPLSGYLIICQDIILFYQELTQTGYHLAEQGILKEGRDEGENVG